MRKISEQNKQQKWRSSFQFRSKFLLAGLLCSTITFPSLGFSAKLNSTDGCMVFDVFTGKPLSGVKVIATTSSDLKSDQRFIKYETKTNKYGKYSIKGLAGRSYQIHLTKEGYVSNSNSGVSISNQGATICRNQDKLLPTLPYSDVEFNFYDPVNKVITKKIDLIPVSDSLNNGYGDVHYYYDKSVVEQLEPIQSPMYVLRVYNKNNGTNLSWGVTDYISRLIPLDDKYEVAKRDDTSMYFSKMHRVYSYEDGRIYKVLYQLPDLPSGFYSLGHDYGFSGYKSLFKVK